MSYLPRPKNGFSSPIRVGKVTLLVGASVLSLSLGASVADATDHRNFSAWKNERKEDKPQRQRTNGLQDGRGFFETLFSFRRTRRLNEAEIQSRLSVQSPPKQFFYTYKPEPKASLTALALDGEIAQAPLSKQVHKTLNSPDIKGLRTFKAHVTAIHKSYAARKFEPVWLSEGGLTTVGKSLLAKLAAAEEEWLLLAEKAEG